MRAAKLDRSAAWRVPGVLVAFALIAASIVLAIVRDHGSAGPGAGRARATGPGHVAGPKLRWAPPKLDARKVVRIARTGGTVRLDPARDYLVVLPKAPVSGAVAILGGHDVLLRGGEIDIAWQGTGASSDSRRGLYLANQTGTIHVEGLWIHGADLTEGINLSEPLGATVQIENVRIDGIHARDERTWSDNHPDLVQTWAGPAQLRIDRLTGSTDYQGLFLAPDQYGAQPSPRSIALSHVNIRATHACTCVLLWKSSPAPLLVRSVWIAPNPKVGLRGSLWPNRAVWAGVRAGRPPGGDYVRLGSVGIHYRSPGYAR